MAGPHVFSALAKKRAELSGNLETTQAKLRQMILVLESLDKTLLMFDPDIGLKRSGHRRSGRQRIGQSADDPDHSRNTAASTEPMTSSDIAIQLISERALDQTDAKWQRLITKRVGVALRGMRDRDVVWSKPGPGMSAIWELAR